MNEPRAKRLSGNRLLAFAAATAIFCGQIVVVGQLVEWVRLSRRNGREK